MSIDDLKWFNEWMRHAEAFIFLVVFPSIVVATLILVSVVPRILATWDVWIENKRNRKDKP